MNRSRLLLRATSLAAAFSFAFLGPNLRGLDSEPAIPLQSLVIPYLNLQKALAADNLDEAVHAAEAFAAILPEGSLPEVAAALDEIGKADGLSEARTEFQQVSDQFIALLRTQPVEHASGLYLTYCPMAFANTGAFWVQDHETVNNPYFGARMLRCGMVRGNLAAHHSGESDPSAGAHHQH